jgi:hypothetical protein
MVYFSLDLEEGDMINYLKEPGLNCPAIRFDAMKGMKKSLGSIYNSDEDGVPVYLVVDQIGNVLSRTIKEPTPEQLAKLTKESARR